MNEPIVVTSSSFQESWAKVIMLLKEHHWEIWNLAVQISNPKALNTAIHADMTAFAKSYRLVLPDQVAYTIFPFKLCRRGCQRQELYRRYQRFFKFTRTQPHRAWGTYFEQMINYCPNGDTGNSFDQLGNIIDSINNSTSNYGASHFIVIPYPKRHAKMIMGAPCLNYVAVQVEKETGGDRRINLLAVYRNHDFLRRAYGNYYGLCKLLEYISLETNSSVGVVTCISSHAYVDNKKAALKEFATSILG